MAIMQVNMPERRDFMSRIAQPMGMASSGLGIWNGIGSLGGGAAAGGAGGAAGGSAGAGYGLGVTPFTPATEGMSPVLGGGQLPPVSSGGQAAGTGASEGLGWSAAGPIAVGVGGMALGAKSEWDYQAKGDKAGNAKYSSHGAGPAIRGDRSMAEAMTRRMDGMKMGNAADILSDAKSSLGDLKIDDPTKALIGKKLDLGLDKLLKLRA